jgi:hypothetical protein
MQFLGACPRCSSYYEREVYRISFGAQAFFIFLWRAIPKREGAPDPDFFSASRLRVRIGQRHSLPLFERLPLLQQ